MPPRRIALTSWGSYGDLFLYLGLAVRLKALGHAPVLATCSYYRSLVEAAGVEFHPLRPDVNPGASDLIRRIMDPARGSEVVIHEILAPAVRLQYDDLKPLVGRVDALVSHPVTFAARIVAEEARLPWLSTVLAPLSFFSISDFPALPAWPAAVRLNALGQWPARALSRLARSMSRAWTAPVRALRTERGLADVGDPLFGGQFSPFGTLALYSPLLGAPQPDWPPRTTMTGFIWYNAPNLAIPRELAAFLDEGEPPIVFTLGSSAIGAAGRFYEESAAAAEVLGHRAVLLTGPQPENRPRALSPRILAVETAAHELLFPRAAAVVHHGGVGTTGQALRAGHPMLVVPFAHDQPDNAHRVERLGVARVLYPKVYRASRVVRELRTLLSPRYVDRARVVGASVRAELGVERACEAILAAASAQPA